MATASLNTIQITERFRDKLQNITSLSVSNLGSSVMFVTVGGVKRPVAPANTDFGCPIPIAPYAIETYGNPIDVQDLVVEFEGGTGNAVLDYIKVNNPNCS